MTETIGQNRERNLRTARKPPGVGKRKGNKFFCRKFQDRTYLLYGTDETHMALTVGDQVMHDVLLLLDN